MVTELSCSTFIACSQCVCFIIFMSVSVKTVFIINKTTTKKATTYIEAPVFIPQFPLQLFCAASQLFRARHFHQCCGEDLRLDSARITGEINLCLYTNDHFQTFHTNTKSSMVAGGQHQFESSLGIFRGSALHD